MATALLTVLLLAAFTIAAMVILARLDREENDWLSPGDERWEDEL